MNFNDISIYINSGWKTVPYQSIRYNEHGKKVTTPNTPWKNLIHEVNRTVTPAGALICGEQLVIDCDSLEAAQTIINEAGWENIKRVEDLYDKTKVSEHIGFLVKTKRGFHFYFNGCKDIEDCKGPQIDIQATSNKLVYLPSRSSEGKEIIYCNKVFSQKAGSEVIKLTDIPNSLKSYIVNLKTSVHESEAMKTVRYIQGLPLAKVKQGSKRYFKRLTPSSFRKIPEYREIIDKKGYLEPNDIKDGDGNSYLIGIAGILARDTTIDVDAFWNNINFINDLWEEPLDVETLTEKVKRYVDNNYANCPFEYDPDWEKVLYSFEDIDGESITICYDLNTGKFLVAEMDTGKIMMKSSADIVLYYVNRTVTKLNSHNIAAFAPGVKLVFNPLLDFGLTEDKKFNIFKRTKYLDILLSDSSYSREEIDESRSCCILDFFKHLFKDSYDYWLKFLKHKLTTFSYSSTVFVLFDERGGAGKGALETWLGHFVGLNQVSKIPYDTFASKFTGDLDGKLFVFLNEYPDERRLVKENTDKIKEWSGGPTLKIEKKGADPYTVENFITFFVTSNRMSVEIKDGDRRFCTVLCDKAFDDVFDTGFFDKMCSDEEMTKLAIFLKTCVDDLDVRLYRRPPLNSFKKEIEEGQLSEVDRALKFIFERRLQDLEDLCPNSVNNNHRVVNLSVLSNHLNINPRKFTSLLKVKMLDSRNQNVIEEIFTDRNKKINKTIFTYARLNSDIKVFVQQDTQEQEKFTLI